MHSVFRITLLTFVTQVCGRELAVKRRADEQDSLDNLGNKVVDKLIDKLVDRAFHMKWLYQPDLDGTTIAKGARNAKSSSTQEADVAGQEADVAASAAGAPAEEVGPAQIAALKAEEEQEEEEQEQGEAEQDRKQKWQDRMEELAGQEAEVAASSTADLPKSPVSEAHMIREAVTKAQMAGREAEVAASTATAAAKVAGRRSKSRSKSPPAQGIAAVATGRRSRSNSPQKQGVAAVASTATAWTAAVAAASAESSDGGEHFVHDESRPTAQRLNEAGNLQAAKDNAENKVYNAEEMAAAATNNAVAATAAMKTPPKTPPKRTGLNFSPDGKTFSSEPLESVPAKRFKFIPIDSDAPDSPVGLHVELPLTPPSWTRAGAH